MKVVDMHCDTIAEIYERRKKGESIDLRKNGLHLDLEKMKKGDYFLQNFALFTALKNVERPFEHTCRLAETFYEEMEANKDLIGVVKTYDDIEKNWKKGKMSALLTIEEAGVCQGDLMLLRFFYHLGVRMMTLTWNYPNELGYPNRLASNSSYFPSNGADDTVLGLTEKGIQFVEEMEHLGMIVDVSHLNDAGFWDVIRYTKKPFVASHSNARALVPDCPRDLTDDMIRALSERGGVAGINYFPPFLSAQDPKAKNLHRIQLFKSLSKFACATIISKGFEDFCTLTLIPTRTTRLSLSGKPLYFLQSAVCHSCRPCKCKVHYTHNRH